ncbi:MAG: response regulator [Phycisphaerae bacterium]
MTVVAYVADLIFMTKISATAQALKRPCRVATTPARLEAALIELKPTLIIVDLNIDEEAVAMVRRIKELAPATPLIAFCSHVQPALAQGATIAGADQVLPRSLFTVKLPDLISGTPPNS